MKYVAAIINATLNLRDTGLNYLFVPWGTVLLEKLNCSHLVKKLPAIFGTRKVITTFTRARRLSLFSARSIQFITSIPIPEDPS